MDRQVSIPLGRPFAISDRDIDVQLPLDVEESCQDMQVLEQASKVDPEVVRTESTSLTAFLHILRLRRIESSIQQAIYRVDQSTNVTDADIEFYLNQLQGWKELVPLDARKQVDHGSVPFDGYDYYGMFLFQPRSMTCSLTWSTVRIQFPILHDHKLPLSIICSQEQSSWVWSKY